MLEQGHKNQDGQILISSMGPAITYLNVVAMQARGAYLIAQKVHSQESYQSSWTHARDCIQIIDSLKNQYQFEKEKEMIIANYLDIFEYFIWASSQLCEGGDQNYCEFALIASDKSKSLSILENIRKRRISQIGDETARGLIEDQIGLSASINKLNLRIEKELSERSSIEISALENSRAQLLAKRNLIIHRIRDEYPRIFQLFFNYSFPSLEEIREHLLDENTVLIEFFEGREHIFVFFLTHDDLILHHVDLGDEEHYFDKNIELKRILYNFNGLQNIDESAIFQQQAYGLYKMLLAPLEKLNKKNLIVIPDGEMEGIPIEVLVNTNSEKQSPDWSDLIDHYLVNAYSISYQHSIRIFLETQGKETPKTNKFAAMIAEYNSIGSLSQSIQSARNVAEDLNGQTLYVSNSTDFLSEAKVFEGILAVLHAEYNAQNPLDSRILFSDTVENNLLAADLLDEHINLDMAFFMSCDLNNYTPGQDRKTHVIRNFAYALDMAGVKSSIISIWKAADGSSNQIIESFFDLLTNHNLDKPHALRQAKLDYINAHRYDPPALHPFFWAHFIQHGDSHHIDLKSPFLTINHLLIGLFLLSSMAFIAWKLKNRQA